ncbi:metal ABC transporter permease [Mariprofundus ferrooxydans]|uniref:Zinc/manganese transport system permease protein n=1 Tax=Mariprofundus ferrooxydans PV-1 TaxID=314345 RepID=Q0EXV8_9PROT|nr:metal ABC transporter permease [Mariprofundus ferrooxydans]EAU54094.1 zinc/manganese transport system permease protein [Mariprofundus ferrooxydans PV-1]KON48897.1 zinc/manganese transporter permease [Mariprofundus ferrooxydans]
MAEGFTILWPALLAGLLVLSTHVPLGRVVLARGIIFIDIAIAQIAGLGVIAAHSAGWESDGWGGQAAAGLAALGAAALFNVCEKKWPDVLEALIGIAFVLASSGSILLLAGDPHAGEQLKDLLVGQILWVGTEQLIYTALLYGLILLAWFGYHKQLGRGGFYLLFAMAVTASVQMVGVYLVFASLIIPALAARGFATAYQLPAAYATGFAGYVAGLWLSYVYDFPSGAIIIWSMAGIALVVLFGRSRSGDKAQGAIDVT